MTVQPIYYQEKPGGHRELWAHHQGTRIEIEESARYLLEELHGEGFKRARVWIGKTPVKRERGNRD